MRKVSVLALIALALLALGGTQASAQGMANQLTVTMNAQNGSGESGTATITESNGQLMVSVNLTGAPSGTPQPAHIHQGTCANLNPKPLYPLSNVVDGKSDTTLNFAMATLQTGGPYAINVHKSATEASTYVSCGDIVMSEMTGGTTSGGTTTGGTTTGGTTSGGTGATSPGMPTTGNGDQNAILIALTLVALSVLTAGFRLARKRA